MTFPICAIFTAATDRPVCSRRCADLDLARWLGDHDAVPVQNRANSLEALEEIERLERDTSHRRRRGKMGLDTPRTIS
jgi:endogenous inhibitor of DNA gyrase (YacG/DUF329 family)